MDAEDEGVDAEDIRGYAEDSLEEPKDEKDGSQ